MRDKPRTAFVSIHVPTYDEPPDVVISTLKTLSHLDYSDFEVIVLDNNTPSPATWEPVKRACGELGARFRFYHYDCVEGAKAGALNLALELTNPSAAYVAIVDADYQVSPNFLTLAVNRLSKLDVSFVQFPQAYRGTGAKAVEQELSDYFDAFAQTSNTSQSMLLTGTLSVIAIDDLRAERGWRSTTVTEDADLGVRLFVSARHGVYLPQIVGRGLLPFSLASLKQQRKRWVAGNVQTLHESLNPRSVLTCRPGTLSVLAQLTAWPAFWLLPIFCLIAGCLLDNMAGERSTIADISAATILLSALFTAIRLFAVAHIREWPLSSILPVLFVKLALVWTCSTAFMPLLWRRHMAFIRTPKRIQWAWLPGGLSGPVLSIVGLIGCRFYLLEHDILPALSCALMILIAPASWWVEWKLKRYARDLQSGYRGDAHALRCRNSDV